MHLLVRPEGCLGHRVSNPWTILGNSSSVPAGLSNKQTIAVILSKIVQQGVTKYWYIDCHQSDWNWQDLWVPQSWNISPSPGNIFFLCVEIFGFIRALSWNTYVHNAHAQLSWNLDFDLCYETFCNKRVLNGLSPISLKLTEPVSPPILKYIWKSCKYLFLNCGEILIFPSSLEFSRPFTKSATVYPGYKIYKECNTIRK